MNLQIFPKHTGIWEGSYIRIDSTGKKIGHWKSKLSIRLFDGNKYQQVNEYFWQDGYYEYLDFGINHFNERGELIFDNPRIQGFAWETYNSICLSWTYRDIPGSRLFEMIDLIGDGTHRVRSWRWTLYNEFKGVTMIDERRTATQDEIPESFWSTPPPIKGSEDRSMFMHVY